MNQALEQHARELVEQAQQLIEASNITELEAKLQSLEKATLTEDFWQQPSSKTTLRSLSSVKKKIEEIQTVIDLQNDVAASLELMSEEFEGHALAEESSAGNELTRELEKLLKQLEAAVKKLKLAQYLSGKYDSFPALVSIHSGQGGTEAMDWAEMVARMYTRYFEQKGWKYQLINESRGDEAGIKAVEYEVQAEYAYGYLKREHGAHRLVRQSPFNADNLRQTSFALVEVLPLVEAEDAEIEIPDEDLEWKFSRSGGAGGQNVNKVNTAVELRHIPSDIVVRAREERSQVQNKERALKKLKSQLALIEEEKRETALAAEKGTHVMASWGNQIRNYVLHPYHLVKDTRTGLETADTTRVLDGDIDAFIQAEVMME